MLNINFWNIAFTIINIVVLYLFLKHFLMKPLMEIMEKRQAQVETDLNDAASEKQEAIRNAMNALPVDFREILELRVVRQLPYEQIAQIMDLPVGTVKSRLARARLQLKKRLDAGNFFETGASKCTE